MYVVYWSDLQNGSKVPKCKEFELSDIDGSLKFMEELRNIQRKDGSVGYITYVSENPDNVTKMGVDVANSSYNWKKRRI